ncbi:MAG: hypothetical protein ACOYWZ_00840 [Bacillota bacterium]
MKNKIFIILIVLLFIISTVITLNIVWANVNTVNLCQYNEEEIKEIRIWANYPDIEEQTITDKQMIGDIMKYLKNLKYKEIKESGLIGGKTPTLIIGLYNENGELVGEKLCIWMTSKGLIDYFNPSFQIPYNNKLYYCTSTKFTKLASFINSLD